MWSNFARVQQPSTSAPPLRPAAPASPPQGQQDDPQPPPSDNPYSINVDSSGGDAWSDDDLLEDELLDDVHVDDNEGTKNDTGGISKSNATDNSAKANNISNIMASSEGAGGIGGWGSTLKSFTQHEPLNLSFGASSSAPSAPALASTAPEAAAEDTTLSTDNQDGGWDDDDFNFNDSIEQTPQKEAAAVPSPAPALTPLGRAAEHFGAALLASMDNEEDKQSYTDDDDNDDDDDKEDHGSGAEKAGGFGGGFVMKGLSRFIEAATAPQQDDEEAESEGTPHEADDADDDGWGDDDLDFHDDENAAAVEDVALNADANAEYVEDDKEEPPTAMKVEEEVQLHSPVGGDEQPLDLQDESPTMEEPTGDGWDDDDDIDITFDTPQQKPAADTPKLVDSGKSSSDIGGISDSIKDFVAMTESALDSEFDSNMWKTPPPKKGAAPSVLMSSNGNDLLNESAISSDMEDLLPMTKGVVSQVEPSFTIGQPATPATGKRDATKMIETKDAEGMSLTEFVDNLDAELSDFTRDTVPAADAPAPVPARDDDLQTETVTEPMQDGSSTDGHEKESYSYDDNKDESPEPLPRSPPPQGVKGARALPHQESWYLNAMEGGKGGVVYGEEQVLEASKLQPPAPKGQIVGGGEILEQQPTLHHEPSPPLVPKDEFISGGRDVVSNDMSIMTPSGGRTFVHCPSSGVGMPLSEMPSSANSARSSPNATGAGVGGENGHTNLANVDLKQSELQCKCLELIMPLPNEEEKKTGSPPRGESGFGTKKLPDGTTVLVNYEQLLQNEATKRILLQRSVEAYEHGMEKLQSKHLTSMETMQEQEIQLASAHSEIESLKDMVMRLQDEKENMVTESQLFEAELSAALQDKEYLEKEVEVHRNIETALQDSIAEKTRSVEVLQSDLSEVRKERDLLNDKAAASAKTNTNEAAEKNNLIESVQQELLEKNSEIESLNDQLEKVSMKPLPDSLKNDVSDMKSTLSSVKDENVMLRAMQREYEVEITELKATVESMDCDPGEVDRLAAEVASLTYELCMKKTDCEETKAALKAMKGKRERADARLAQYKRAVKEDDNHSAASSKTEQSSRGEDGMLYKQLADLQVATSSLENQKSELETSLEHKAKTIQGLEMQVKNLNDKVMDSSATNLLQEELGQVKITLEKKVTECEESVLALQMLRTKLDGAKAEIAAYTAAASKEEINRTVRGDAELSLKAANGLLDQQIEDLQAAQSSLEGQKLVLEKSLEEKAIAIQGLDVKAMQTDNIHRSELSRVQKSLNDKAQECDVLASTCEQLKTELLNSQSNRDMILSKSEENANKSQEEVSRLQSQIADLLRDHNVTMRSIEEQLTNSLQQTSTLHAECEQYRINLEDAEKECANISQSSSDSIAKYSEHISSLQGENVDLSTALQAAQSSLEAHQLEASGDDSKIQQLQGSLDSMKQEMDSIAHRHQELMDKNHFLMQEKADLTQSLDARAGAAEHQSAKLRSELDSTQKASSDAKEAVANLTEQLQALKNSNAQLEDKLFEASFETPEDDNLVEENSCLRKERDALKEETIALSQRVTELASTSVEKEALIGRMNTLEEEAKADKLDELRDEITSLHEERQQLDLDNEELLVQLGLMQQDKLENHGEIELELETLRGQVSTLQDQCTRLQSDLDSSRNSSLLSGEVDHLKILQNDNHSLHQTISQLNGENESLMEQINGLTQKINDLELQISEVSIGETGDDEIKALREQIHLLEKSLASKEEDFELAKKEVKLALESRDMEIVKLATEYSSANAESLQSQYQRAEQDQVGVQLDQAQDDGGVLEEEKFYEDDDDDISLQDLLAEAVLDSDDYLRSQIVVLAQALERSELQRADLLERIFTDRKTNTDSLRQLGESVKRFYTSVR